MLKYTIKTPVKSYTIAPCARRRGIALISTLWLIALIAAFAFGLQMLMKSDHLNGKSALDALAAEGNADAGVFLTIQKLCDAHHMNEVIVDGQTQILSFNGQQVAVSVQDEYGKIDLNFAPKEILASLLLSISLTEDTSKSIASAIDQKRKSTFQQVSDQMASGNSLSPKFPFHTIEELKSIPGITNEIFHKIQPAITVYSQQATVQTSTAPPEVLAAMPNMQEQQISDVLTTRQSTPVTANSIGFTEMTSTQGSVSGRSFTIRSKAQTGKALFIRRAVVLITGDAHRPYKVLDWSIDY